MHGMVSLFKCKTSDGVVHPFPDTLHVGYSTIAAKRAAVTFEVWYSDLDIGEIG
jgi:hypothetical protein